MPKVNFVYKSKNYSHLKQVNKKWIQELLTSFKSLAEPSFPKFPYTIFV